jgi:hypothetical protein
MDTIKYINDVFINEKIVDSCVKNMKQPICEDILNKYEQFFAKEENKFNDMSWVYFLKYKVNSGGCIERYTVQHKYREKGLEYYQLMYLIFNSQSDYIHCEVFDFGDVFKGNLVFIKTWRDTTTCTGKENTVIQQFPTVKFLKDKKDTSSLLKIYIQAYSLFNYFDMTYFKNINRTVTYNYVFGDVNTATLDGKEDGIKDNEYDTAIPKEVYNESNLVNRFYNSLEKKYKGELEDLFAQYMNIYEKWYLYAFYFYTDKKVEERYGVISK